MFSIFSGNVLARVLGGASGGFLGAILVSSGAMAQVDVPAGETLTVPPDISEQVQLGDGSTLLVEQGGTLTSNIITVIDTADGTSVTVDNNGTIQSTGIAGVITVDVQGSTLDLINRTFGLIESNHTAVSAGEIGTVNNSGVIMGLNGLISTGSLELLRNSGRIEGDRVGVYAFDTIGHLTNSGIIHGDSLAGVDTAHGIELLNNSGSIFGGQFGVYASNSIGRLTNSGTIMGEISGVHADGNIEHLTNSGVIWGDEHGVFSGSPIGQLNNSGSIVGGANAVYSNGSIDQLTNSGTIESTIYSVFAGVSIGQLFNSGTITSDQSGVLTSGSIGQLINSGTIAGDDIGVYASGAIEQLTNSGTISGSIAAIFESGGSGDTLLTLLAGSVIDGPIYLGGGTNTLVVGNGLSLATTFENAPPVIGTTNGAPYTIQGNQVIVADPTNLAMQGDFLANLTGGIYSALDGAVPDDFGNAGGIVVQPLGYAASPDEGNSNLPELITHGNSIATAGPELFVQTFGNFSRQAAQVGTADAFMASGGIVAGIKSEIDSQMRTGLFGGASTGMIQTGNGAQYTGTQSFFGGVTFEMNSDGTGVDLKLLAGYNGNDRTRQVANNQVAGGIEDAEASYNGWFVAPELTVSQQLGDSPLIASATLGYIGAWLDGFDETGTSGNMSVADRALHVGHARLQLAMPVLREQVEGTRTRIVANGGVEGRLQFSDGTIEGTLAGDEFTFDAGAGTNFAAFAGLSGTHQLDNGALFNGSVSGRIGLEGSIGVSGDVGVSQSF